MPSVNSKRITVRGKFFYDGDVKFYMKGVTYGTFMPDEEGNQFPSPEIVEHDFALMSSQGINSVRTYTVPPRYLLDKALYHGLKVMVGLPWEQHVTFLDSKKLKQKIRNRIKEGVASCAKHAAVLCYAIGNEVPAPIVRFYGKEKIEDFLKSLHRCVKEIDDNALVTYVNYPTTEYLDLSFLDFFCFNVYLESPGKLSSYVSRLHNLAGDRPLVLAEIGLDSRRNGVERQAEVLEWQIVTAFGKGCAGMFVFAWTDEWWRGGFSIDDWDFGLVDRSRNSKPALHTVRNAMKHVPMRVGDEFPSFSIIVCSYNGSATIRDTLAAIARLKYPRFEVIVVNDGSTDNLKEIVEAYRVKLISTPNAGLSNARNTGMYNANGDILAYIDDDAYPDEHWLHYLAFSYTTTSYGAIGGPNLIPAEDGPVAHCVANAPGGPVHVLETDEIAEHIPGCNLTVRRNVLMKIGGFDPIYRAAGDDVDVCWRIKESGYNIGFHPSALVWHHRRNSFKAYWKQQKGYGKAESLLEGKWPHKYNGFGHLGWSGRIYGHGWTMPLTSKKPKVFHGTWGTALFQSVYQPANAVINCLPLMPEWYLLAALLAGITSLGFVWAPLLWAAVAFILSVLIIIAQAIYSASKNTRLAREHRKVKYYLLIVALHIVQPAARLYGRIKFGLTPWRKRGAGWSWKHLPVIHEKTFLHWSEKWHANEDYLRALEENLINQRLVAQRGGDFDRWDLQTGNKLFASVRCLLAVEEHGAGKQYVKIKSMVSFAAFSLTLIVLTTLLAGVAFMQQKWFVGAVFGFLGLIVLVKCIIEKSNVLHSLDVAVNGLPKQEVVTLKLTEEPEEQKIKRKNGSKAKSRLLKLRLMKRQGVIDEKPLSLSEVRGV